jgi:hypothetical protein
MSKERKKMSEKTIVGLLVLVFTVVGLYLLVMGISELGIFSATLIQKALNVTAFTTYSTAYGYFLIGMLALAFIAFIAFAYFRKDAEFGGVAAGVVIGLLLTILGIYAGYLMTILGVFILGFVVGFLVVALSEEDFRPRKRRYNRIEP